jgi:hypothetical protein
MTEFRTPTDVGNRALQLCGADMMDPVLGFTEPSRNARQVSFAYGKLREAELQRRLWTFATRRQILRAIDGNTMLMTPALWSSTTTYFAGSIVADQVGSMWISNIPNNLGFDPLLTTVWEPYFGPRAIPLYVSGTAYSAGEVVYTAAGDGTNRVYLSLQSGNSDVPATATPWDATVTFFKNQVVTYLSVAYMSLIDLNLNNIPSVAPALFNIATTYAIGNTVGASDGAIYTSLANGNVGNDPTLDGGVHWSTAGVLNPWTTVFVGGAGSDKWLQLGGKEFPFGVGLTTLNIVYPLNSGPSSQLSTRNSYMKPAGYLRIAPQNPKSGLQSLGGPTGNSYDDWLFEGRFLISGESGPLPLRFIANVTDVALMHTNFCELLACDIALAVCQTITQSDAKLNSIRQSKRDALDNALVDGIENGWVDPPEDDLIAVRL